VEDLKNGQNFNELINLPGSSTVAGSSGDKAGPGLLTIPEPGQLNPGQLAQGQPAPGQLAQPAAQAAQKRYLGRQVSRAETQSRNKGANLTEEEKIGQLKKIKKSAEDYEGLLLKEMIKSLRQSPLAKTPGSETYSEIAEKPFTAAITAAGGLGLAEKIVDDVARQEGLTETLRDHPEIMGPNYRPKISPNRMRKAPVARGATPEEAPGSGPGQPKTAGSAQANPSQASLSQASSSQAGPGQADLGQTGLSRQADRNQADSGAA
jgi:Rod binding domain-containing protein